MNKEERKYNKPVFKWGNKKEETTQYLNKQFDSLTNELKQLKAEAERNGHSIKSINTRYIALLLWEMRTQGKDIFDKNSYRGNAQVLTYLKRIKTTLEKDSIEEVIKPFLYINCFPDGKSKKPVNIIQ